MQPSIPWAVHIAGGVLSWPTLAVGFVVVGLLALLAAWRIREEEVPRVALLTAAFFVASSIHVKLGLSSVHLLLNGLVGVILGRRAPLAILIGVTLQALLIAHGDLSTIGVNACAETLPALLAGGLFGLLSRWGDDRPWVRSGLVGTAALAWGACLVLGLTVLWTNPLADLLRWTNGGLVVSVANFQPAGAVLCHPLTLAGLGLLALAAAGLERRWGSPPGFARGLLVGVLAVVTTTALTGLVLLLDGAERWSTLVSALFVAHLPLALIEGLIVGTIVAFLYRVKPEMLGAAEPRPAAPPETLPGPTQAVRAGPMQALLALLSLLALGGPALAHALEVSYTVDVAAKRVTVKGFYETGDAPEMATARVLREGGTLLAEGPLDNQGHFEFSYEKAEPLSVHLRAPGGHRAVALIKASELEAPAPASAPARGTRLRDLLLGLGLVLALASFVMSWRNSQRLQRLAETVERRASD